MKSKVMNESLNLKNSSKAKLTQTKNINSSNRNLNVNNEKHLKSMKESQDIKKMLQNQSIYD
jgi:hypothetical protein